MWKIHWLCCTGWQTPSIIPISRLTGNYIAAGKRRYLQARKGCVTLLLCLIARTSFALPPMLWMIPGFSEIFAIEEQWERVACAIN